MYFFLLTVTYLCGTVMAEFSNVSIDRHPIYFFTTYIFIGSYTLVFFLASQGVLIAHELDLGDLGCLYTAVACLLNLLLVIDVVALAVRQGKKASWSLSSIK